MDLEFHPYANLFPLMERGSPEGLAFTDNIKTDGIKVPIVLYQERILDGRNRYLVHKDYPDEVELKTEVFEGTDDEALALVLSLNVNRRNLDESQKALVAVRYYKIQPNITNQTLTQKFGVHQTYIKNVLSISKDERRQKELLLKQIEIGELSVKSAYTIFKTLPADLWAKAITTPAKAKQLGKQIKRQEKEHKLHIDTAKASRELQAKGESGEIYNVIYIDPPWSFETYSENGKDRSAENHYPTMTLEDIRGTHIPAANDCVMFMWSTAPHLAVAIETMQGWGFDYKSVGVWNKITAGTGYWFRSKAEFLLVGVKGTKIQSPLPDQMMDQIVGIQKTKHSEKPDQFAHGIANMYPDLPKLEMFARKKRQGWTVWGNEVVDDEPSAKISTGKTTRKRNGKKNGNGTNGTAPGATEETESQESISP